MAEPPTEVTGSQDVPPPGNIADASFRLADDPPTTFHQPAPVPIADESPTIISRLPRGPARPDEAITANLRGRQLAHFELQEAVGVGGMAAVIRAHDKQLDRDVALKILPPQMAADPESIRRFHQEARSAARLDHENIARVFFCGEDQGLHFIAFEFVEGQNLRVMLERRGRLPASEAIHYMLQVATGLAHAAARGVVHRDIKPSNIIITPQGRAKLVDMGLARSLGPQADGDLTQSGVTLGTFDYISPEQALEPRDADVRSDIYSLGCTFYHVLTGQPSVPEGTAAKKLHHHQHVLPVDPRQLNAAIPDDVAAVLARMMAKDPKDRYQRCEHLVQHLMQLAQKMGHADIPEGMLYLDAPLPNPPKARPLVVAAFAAAALIAAVALLGALPSGNLPSEMKLSYAAPRPIPAPVPEPKTTAIEVTSKKPDLDPPPISRPAVTVRNAREFADALKQSVAHVIVAGDIDLNEESAPTDVPGVVFRGEELTVEAEAGKRPTIRLNHELNRNPQIWAALTMYGGKATIRGLRFLVDAKGTQTLMAALCQRDGGSLTVSGCEFIQEGLSRPSDPRHQASILVPAHAAPAALRPSLFLERCLFRKGARAVWLDGDANVQLVDCAFGPHPSLFYLRGSALKETEVSLRHCSALLDSGAAVLHLDNGAACKKFLLNSSLVSGPRGATEAEGDGAVLVRQTGDSEGDLRYEVDQRNVFHNVTPYWVREKPQQAGTPLASTLDKFKKETQAPGRADPSIELTASPWDQERPFDWIEPRAEKDKPWRAFAVNLKLADLRTEDNPRRRVLGVEHNVWGRSYPEELPTTLERDPEPPVRKSKIVDPTAMESGRGIYPSIGLALGDARPGDEILIRCNGVLPVEPVRLERKTADVTIRPAKNCKPILTLGPTTERDAALLRLYDGKVRFEDLEFHLQPTRADFKAQSIVCIIGDGQCSFKNCLITQESIHGVPVSLVALAVDPNNVMMMDPGEVRTQVARVKLESCFVRGSGDLVSVRASRPFLLDVDECLIALDGSLLVIDGNAKDAPTKPAAQVALRQTTTYLTEHLIHMRKEESKPVLVPTQLTAVTNCLFHAVRPGRSLVRIEGIETDDQMRRVFTWGDGKQNQYSGYAQYLDQMPPRGDNMVPLPPYDADKWKAFASRDVEGRYEKAKFAAWPLEGRPLTQAWPSNFRVKDPEAKAGAPVDRLRTPSNEGESAPSPTDGE